jgi:hypothetical protein
MRRYSVADLVNGGYVGERENQAMMKSVAH